MPFFIRKKQGKTFSKKQEKRKKPSKPQKNVKKQKVEKVNRTNEIISSAEEDLSDNEKQIESFSSEEETEQEKKLRLTKKYLEQIEKEENDKAKLNDTKDAVAHRLKEEALEEAGRLQKKVAQDYENVTAEQLFVLKGHKLSITCLAVSNSEKYVYSGSKDCSIIKWSLETGKRVKVIAGGKNGAKSSTVGHTAHVLSLAISDDDKFLASGCRNNIINIWNPDTMELLKTFKGHRDAVCGLTFQKGSHELISASNDRSLKLWNLDEMGYIETLFGHQDSVTDIDCFNGKNAITSGGRDSTVRIWKIVEESQLVFQGHGSSIDCVCVSSPQHFVSGADDGSLSLWGLNKKKPLFKLPEVHGRSVESGVPNWITSVCALRNTDLVASGSCDGQIRLWRRDDEKHTIQPVINVEAKGFVNALCFSLSGKFLIAGLGQEHKLGRWWSIKAAKNTVTIYRFPTRKR